MTGCKIGKIQLKGGAELRVFESNRKLDIDYCRRQFERAANQCLEDETDMAGFFIVAWGSETTSDYMAAMPHSRRHHPDIPDYVRTVALRRICEKRTDE